MRNAGDNVGCGKCKDLHQTVQFRCHPDQGEAAWRDLRTGSLLSSIDGAKRTRSCGGSKLPPYDNECHPASLRAALCAVACLHSACEPSQSKIGSEEPIFASSPKGGAKGAAVYGTLAAGVNPRPTVEYVRRGRCPHRPNIGSDRDIGGGSYSPALRI